MEARSLATVRAVVVPLNFPLGGDTLVALRRVAEWPTGHGSVFVVTHKTGRRCLTGKPDGDPIVMHAKPLQARLREGTPYAMSDAGYC